METPTPKAAGPLARWQQLQPGQNVRLTGPTGEEYRGVVDERTEDGAFLWVLTMGSGRRLFHVEDGFEATPVDVTPGQTKASKLRHHRVT